MSNKFFEELYSATGKEIPNATGLDVDQKAALAQRMKNHGFHVREIAEHLECSASNVYKLLKKDVEIEMSEMECKTYFDTFMERRQMLIDQIDKYKKYQETIRCGPKSAEKDPETGDYIDAGKKGSTRDYAEIGRIIQKYEEMLIRLEDHVGILPTEKSSNLFHSLSDMNPHRQEEEEKELNDEQAANLLIEKLQSTSNSIRRRTLKELKDERVV